MTRQEARRWIAAAVQDGWEWKQIPQLHEDEHFDLTKRGYRCMVHFRGEQVRFSLWGPDDLAVDPPTAYEWGTLELRARMCQYCNKVGPTVRIGFSGRCCPRCRELHKADVERPGWDN